jgi:DNA-binding response OmpR family regulator
LVVDDEPSLVRVVVGYLEREGFDVRSAADGESALDVAREQEPDVVVLDLGLPGIDGLEVCRRLRIFSDCYVLMLTARADEADEHVDMLVGLAVGADDYVTKPFSPRELVARIRVLLRRPRSSRSPDPRDETIADGRGPGEQARRFGALTVLPMAREVLLGGASVDLTKTEFDLLATLSARPRQVFSRRQLIEAVWGPGWVGDEHLVDIHLGHVRRKLGDDPASPAYVLTVRGVGYRMGRG